MLPMYLVKQNFTYRLIDNVEDHIRAEMHSIRERIFPGMKICLTYGSRGFPYGVRVIRTLVETFKAWGADPFIIPAMGSHGGGTDEGQIQVLKKLGVTEEALNVPIKSCVESVLIGETNGGIPVYCDKYALEADGVFLFNRVKPHTGFRAPIESGLTKMMAVGMGKVKGAEAAHQVGLGHHIVEMADVIEKKINLLGGIASVDNFRGEALLLKGVRPEERIETEKALLKLAWEQLPKIPFDHLHVLIVDRMGKNISGSGMDVNVIGIHRRLGGNPVQKYETIVVLDLTPESEGNALGLGYADLTTKELVNKINFFNTYKNAFTTGFLGSVKIPCTMPSAREAIEAACKMYGVRDCRVTRIKDTKHLEYLWISEPLLKEAANLEIIKRVDSVFDIREYC
ncbi:MAG: lactate racemase domain-containing protein [Bacillota bacterium]